MTFGKKTINHLNKLKIKDKLLAIYIIAFVVPFIVISVILSVWLNNTLMKWTKEQMRSGTLQTSTLFRDALSSVEDLSDALYINKQIQTTLGKTYSNIQEVYDQYLSISFLDDFLQANRDIASIRYYTENTTVLDNAYFIKATPDITSSNWYVQARYQRGKSFWVMKTDNITRRKTLSLVRAVQDLTDGRFLGVLSLNIDYDRINRFLMNQGKETYIAMDGVIEFASISIPHEDEMAKMTFTKENFPLNNISFVETELHGTKSLALINQIVYNSINSIQVIQLVPMSQLGHTTMQAVFIYIAIFLTAMGISFLLINSFSHYFTDRITYINSEIKKVVQNNFEIGPALDGRDELTEIYSALATTSTNIKTLIDEVYQHKIDQEQLLARQNDIRFKMLASQINPHFLFNTLETIRMQALSDGNRDVAQTIKLLAKILRHNLEISNRPVPVFQEIEAVSNYLDIQHLRFADRVSYDIICLCDIRSCGILPLLIQPVVENSFIHGLEARQKGGFIFINIDSDGESLYIKIRDNGVGMNSEKLEMLRQKLDTCTVEQFSSSIGMVNVNQRIKLYYGNQYGLAIESEENCGTTVTIHLPLVPIAEKGE